jgi:hypothetical protein
MNMFAAGKNQVPGFKIYGLHVTFFEKYRFFLFSENTEWYGI